jgi:2-amino-4-hydroxy-6-hydroxymethyldihydropteridine diphosphokinase
MKQRGGFSVKKSVQLRRFRENPRSIAVQVLLKTAPGSVRLTPHHGLCFNRFVETDAYISLGSNTGDRELNLLRAVAEIGKLPDSRVTALSPFYETSPVGVTDQPHFINAVLRLSTGLSPQELLNRLQRIEDMVFGRVRDVRWGPRSIDLDLVLFGGDVIGTEGLTVPHPLMAERRFVLRPLCDIAPDLVHPVLGKTMTELLAGLRSGEIVVKI